MTPLVTVVTVVYNAKAALGVTLKSVLSQKFTDFQYLVVDGGSDDGTGEYLAGCEKAFNDAGIGFAWVSERDGGLYDAMNKGSRMASGEWLLYLNAGDEFYDVDVLCDMSAILGDGTTASVVYGDVCSVDGDREYVMHSDRTCACIEKSSPFCHQGAFIRRQVQLDNPYDTKYRLAADYGFFLKLYRSGHVFLYEDRVVARFPLDGASNTNRRAVYREYDSIWRANGMRKGVLGGFKTFLGYAKVMVADALPDRLVYAIMNMRINGGDGACDDDLEN
jgi:glycosyltransferase involved in cell wall biosynthesis